MGSPSLSFLRWIGCASGSDARTANRRDIVLAASLASGKLFVTGHCNQVIILRATFLLHIPTEMICSAALAILAPSPAQALPGFKKVSVESKATPGNPVFCLF